jgi:hypothetical protein
MPPKGNVVNMIPPILLDWFPPCGDALLAKCGKLVSDDMLNEISQADYGMDASAHFAALAPIRDTARVPTPMPWEPKEVLEPIRWSQPEDPTWKPGSTGERGHVMRAFCCAALLRAAAEPENDGHFSGENETLIQLIYSALILNSGFPEATGSYLTWRIPRMRGDDEERPFFAFGLIALLVLLKPGSLTTSNIDTLVSFVEQAEADVRCPMGDCTPEMIQASFLSWTYHSLRHAAWRALAATMRMRLPDFERVVALARRIEAA